MNIQEYFHENERQEQEKADQTAESPGVTPHGPEEGSIVIPVNEETVQVHKEVMESAKVRVQTTVSDVEKSFSVPLTGETYDIKRVAINELIDERPQVREEGDCIIIPVVIIQKRLKLVEEVHITKRQTTTTHQENIIVKKEDVVIERLPIPNNPRSSE